MPAGKRNPNPRGGAAKKNGGAGKNKTTTEPKEPKREANAQERAAQHIGGERKKIMRECHKTMNEIEAARKALSERAGEVRLRFKNGGMNFDSFMAARKLVNMADTVARDDYIDGLQEGLNNLGVPTQLDFVDALERTEADEVDRIDAAMNAANGENDGGAGGGDAEGLPETSDDDFEEDDRPNYLRTESAMGTA